MGRREGRREGGREKRGKEGGRGREVTWHSYMHVFNLTVSSSYQDAFDNDEAK